MEEFFKSYQLFSASLSPSRPKDNEHRFSFEVAEGNLFSIQTLERKSRSFFLCLSSLDTKRITGWTCRLRGRSSPCSLKAKHEHDSHSYHGRKRKNDSFFHLHLQMEDLAKNCSALGRIVILDPFGGTKPRLAGRGKEAVLRVNPLPLARSKAGESKG